MTTEHTPGPWDYGSHCIINTRNGAAVLVTEKMMKVADARMIAAAPDLWAALGWLLGSIEAPRDEDYDDRLLLACGAARSALAKAEGR